MKICSNVNCKRSGVLLKDDEFPKRKDRKTQLQAECYDCKNLKAAEYRNRPEIKQRIKINQSTPEWKKYHNKKQKERYKKNPEKTKHYNLKSNYGLTLEKYNFILNKQDYKCQICNRHQDNVGTLCVDHDHETGEIRGLLCGPCNKAIGLFQDNIDRMNEAILYIVKNKKVRGIWGVNYDI